MTGAQGTGPEPHSEARFRALAETTTASVFIYQGEFIRYLNAAARELLGYSEAELSELRFWDVVHPDFRELVRTRGRARMRGEDVPTQYEFKVVTRGGQERWVEASAHHFLWDGEPAVLGTAVDITERKRAEEDRDRVLALEQAARRQAETALAEQSRLQEKLDLLVEASGTLAGMLDQAALHRKILEVAQRLIAADACAVWRHDPGSPEWRLVAAMGLYSECSTLRLPASHEVPAQPRYLENVQEDPRFAPVKPFIEAERIRGALLAPLAAGAHGNGLITFYFRGAHQMDRTEMRLAAALANLAGSALRGADAYAEESRTRAAAEAAQRGWAFLAESSAILASSLDYENTLAAVGRCAVPRFADACAVHILEEDGQVRMVALAHADPEKQRRALEMQERFPAPPGQPFGPAHVIRSGQPEFAPQIEEAMLERHIRGAERLERFRRIGVRSYMCLPLRARGRTLGALSFVQTDAGRCFSPEDFEVADHLARRAALAVDNARLYATAQRERRAAEAALAEVRKTEQRFRRLVDSNIVGMVLIRDDQVLEANDVFLSMIGYTREELAAGALRSSALTPPEYHERDARGLAELMSRGACVPVEKEIFHKDGHRVPILVGRVLLESEPQPVYLAFVLDLAERKALEERLRQSQKLESLGLLAGGVAHDFNNLLTAILGNASLALEMLSEQSPAAPRLADVIGASERAAELTRQLLAYSGKGRFVVRQVDLRKLVREIVGLVQVSSSRKVNWEMHLDDPLPPISGDESQMGQLIMNLALNAAEAIGEESGVVRFTATTRALSVPLGTEWFSAGELAAGRHVCLEVKDTGAGMDSKTLARIFDPFFTTKFTGRGLGLSAVQGIVIGHHGAIRVRSAPGLGSTFEVFLPASDGTAAAVAPAARPQELHGRGTILVVDDEPMVRETARHTLERYGYLVLLADDGQRGLELFRRHAAEVALVLLDMTMPRVSGDQAIGEIKRIRADVPVLASSGYHESEAERRFGAGQAAGFLQKPYTASQLAEKVRGILKPQMDTEAEG